MAWGQPTTLLDKSTRAVIFLEAQLLCYEIDVTDTLTHGRLAFFGLIFFVCGLIWMFYMVLPPRI